MNSIDHETEKQAIRQAIMDYYHQGHVEHDARLYEHILHPEYKFFLFDESGLLLSLNLLLTRALSQLGYLAEGLYRKRNGNK